MERLMYVYDDFRSTVHFFCHFCYFAYVISCDWACWAFWQVIRQVSSPDWIDLTAKMRLQLRAANQDHCGVSDTERSN